MAVTGKLFGLLFTSLFNKEIDYEADDIRTMLTTDAYAPNQDTHDYKDDVTNEVVGAGYVADGKLMAGKSVTYTAGTNKHMLDANDVEWEASTITARNGVVYDDTPVGDGAKPLISYQDFGEDIITSNGLFKIEWNASGIVEITVG